MVKDFPIGVWPTMITPFTEKNEVDYKALEQLIEWYIEKGVDGLFAVCQSSEMFFLSLEERIKIARFTVEKVKGRIPVISSGHVSYSFEDQVKELTLIAETGVDAVVLITNRLARQEDSDEIWLENLKKLLSSIPKDIALGFYECPFPYKRLISPELLKWCAGTGRFFFLKDTSCDVKNIKDKLDAVKGSELKIYNANTATLLETLKLGAAGYSGVMCNFHPNYYVYLLRHWKDNPQEAEELSNFLTVTSFIERQFYPVNGKYNLSLEGIKISMYCRSRDCNEFTDTERSEVEQLHQFSKGYSEKYHL